MRQIPQRKQHSMARDLLWTQTEIAVAFTIPSACTFLMPLEPYNIGMWEESLHLGHWGNGEMEVNDLVMVTHFSGPSTNCQSWNLSTIPHPRLSLLSANKAAEGGWLHLRFLPFSGLPLPLTPHPPRGVATEQCLTLYQGRVSSSLTGILMSVATTPSDTAGCPVFNSAFSQFLGLN